MSRVTDDRRRQTPPTVSSLAPIQNMCMRASNNNTVMMTNCVYQLVCLPNGIPST